MINILQYR